MKPSEPTPALPGQEFDLSGRELGDYRLLRRLGRGGMADVYLAEQRSLRRQVALKVLKNGLAADESYVQRFHREAQAAASLVHANIVQIYEVGRIDGIHYIAQEYVPGQNLRDFIHRQGSPDARLAVRILRQVASALSRAEQRGIVHRDIKPENIMITRAAEVKVADFGLARLTRDADALHLTQDDKTMGTPLYMSPEQVEGKPLDIRSDLYSLGVTAYHMLAGRPPFQGETALAVAVQHLRSQPERIEGARPDLPPGLCRIVHRLLEKDPARRFNSAKDVIRALQSLEPTSDGTEEDELWDGLDARPASRCEATQRLDLLMKTQAAEIFRPSGGAWRRLAFWALLAVLLGAITARLTRGPSLLADLDAQTSGAMERMESAQAQYVWASLFRSESHYRSVLEYFPDDIPYVRMAKRDLALLHLEREEYPQAAVLFDELANLEAAEVRLRATGLAGQAVIRSHQGRHSEVLEKLYELKKLRDAHRDLGLDPKLTAHLNESVLRIFREQGREAEVRRWLQEALGGPL